MKTAISTYNRCFCFKLISLWAAYGFLSVDVTAQTIEEDASQIQFTINSKADERIAIPFDLVNNLVVIQLQINGSTPLKFILDSGVGNLLITGLPDNEEISLYSSNIVSLAGLGEEEPVQAFYSKNNQIRLGPIEGEKVDILFLLEDIFNLSNFMGTYVHGLIGYDIFSNFAVEINYRKKVIYLYNPPFFEKKFQKLSRHQKWNKYPITIENKKPYMNLLMRNTISDSLHQMKLLVDSGSSNAFSFYETTSNFIKLPKSRIESLLGVGLSGNIPGFLGRVEEVQLGDFIFEHPVIAFPDSQAVGRAISLSDRNGSLGGEVLRRFKVIFHYPMQAIFLRSNRDLKDDFSYNSSGIDIITPFPNLPYYVVSNVREQSPAYFAGIEKGDILDRINGSKVEDLSLNEVLSYLENRNSSSLRIEVEKDSTHKTFFLTLENELKVDF